MQGRQAALLHRRGREARSRRRSRRPRRCAGPSCGTPRRPRDAPALVGLEADLLERERVGRALAPGGVEDRLGRDRLARREAGDDAVASLVVTAATFSLRRKVTLLRRRMNCSASPISPSRNVSTRGRWSTTVTFVPRRPNIDAYSTPITPAPTTVMLRGRRWWRCRRPSESMIVSSSNSTSAGRAGFVPTAMMMFSAVTVFVRVVVGDRRRCARRRSTPSPNSRPTRLRRNCSRTTCASAPTTRAVRSIRNSIAWRSRRSGLQRVGDVERAAGELVEHRHAQRLGRDRAGVDGDAAEPLAALDDGDALAELGGLDGRLLAARAGADDEKVEVHGASLTPRTPSRLRRPRQRGAVEHAGARLRRLLRDHHGHAGAGPEARAQRRPAEHPGGVAQL